jgi:protein involved in polysaccharide export with SLBB domain
MTILTVLPALSSGQAGPQERAKNQPPTAEKAEPTRKAASPRPARAAEEREEEISALLDEFDLKPHAQPSIPDDPPPHEGAMVSLTYTVEPPDLVIVEVLDALPGRPISGERLVRPDGTISLGFYGEVYVRGLTPRQAKVAILKQLRNYLTDVALGLETFASAPAAELPAAVRPPIPDLPKDAPTPLPPDNEAKEQRKPRPSSARPRSNPRAIRPRAASSRAGSRGISVRPVRSSNERAEPQDQPAPAAEAAPVKIVAGGQGKVTITIELNGLGPNLAEKPQPMPTPGPADRGEDGLDLIVVPPADSATVFVDMTAYNTKNYYVLGDVRIVGKLAWTGHETVLDALQFAGGLMPSAEPKDIRLVRPGRGGKPTKVYKIDLADIEEKGDVTKNYQIFPNDRLIVGRNEVVKKTVEIDRLSAPIQSITSFMSQQATMLRAVQSATADHREELLKEFVDFWANELSRPDGVKFDEQALREAFQRKMKLTPPPVQPAPAPR